MRVFHFNSTNWVQLGNRINGDSFRDEAGFQVKLNDDGTILALSALGHTSTLQYVKIFQFNQLSSSWDQLGQTLYGQVPCRLDTKTDFGKSVSLSSNGQIVAIGAPLYNEKGRVYVYEFDGTNWNPRGNFIDGEASPWDSSKKLPCTQPSERFGDAMSMNAGDATVIAVGVPRNQDAPGVDAGQVRIFIFNGTDWSQRGSTIRGERADDPLGEFDSVGLSHNGNIVVIGAVYNDGDSDDINANFGHIRVFQWNGSDYEQLGGDLDGPTNVSRYGHILSGKI